MSRLTRIGSTTARFLQAGLAGLPLLAGAPAHAGSILFIGNSFTFGARSPVQNWRPGSVTDLNAEGVGGMPALFKAFTEEAGLHYDVSLETHGGVGLDWHLDHKLPVIGQRPWDMVVMHGYSLLDAVHPGDPATLIANTKKMAGFLAARNPGVEVRLLATWPRADQVYEPQGAWYGKGSAAMGRDLRAGYEQAAAAAAPVVKGVIPVGDAWLRAMATGVALSNPYDEIDAWGKVEHFWNRLRRKFTSSAATSESMRVHAGKLDLWADDNYHATTFGYYLEALVVFGAITGRDPRSLGENECAAFELGLSTTQAAALQKVASDELRSRGAVNPESPKTDGQAGRREKCPSPP